eukprot:TRINITY_DN21433_c0_g1_i1.p1 TRINITY_DN21433_c0_g1~~TRINITY_DN21433_c0_g1_i1.p1  ORF type:complete len:564 (-),score=102.76 TRINITY_DN21433_c0_g1_i1:443-2134(-)
MSSGYGSNGVRHGRCLRRTLTAPAARASRIRIRHDHVTGVRLTPPCTDDVNRHLQTLGPTATPLEVALGIIVRLQETKGLESEELLFVAECLKAGRSKTSVPFRLQSDPTRGEDPDADEVQDYLVSTFSRSAACTPSNSRRSVSLDGALSPDSHCEDLGILEDDSGCHDTCICPRALETALAMAGSLNNKAESPELRELLNDGSFDEWSFDTFELSRLTQKRPLECAAWEAMRRESLFADTGIDPDVARSFLKQVEGAYKNQDQTPYHNNLHAADVTQAVHAMLVDFGFDAYFDSISRLSLVLSAAVHDMGHDGRTNAFHVNIRDDLALTHNDQSVLENFHISSAFKLLASRPEANLLRRMSPEYFQRIRFEMINSVLATDMAHHFTRVAQFKTLEKNLGSDPADWTAEENALNNLHAMLLHAADIGAPTKKPSLADQWAERVITEFFEQGAEEELRQLPISPLCDRRTTKKAGSQVGFLRFIVEPTWQLLAKLRARVEEVALQSLQENISLWDERKALEDKAGEDKKPLDDESDQPHLQAIDSSSTSAPESECSSKEYQMHV